MRINLGAHLAQARKEANLSMRELADMADIAKSFLWQIENNQRQIPDAALRRMPESIRSYVIAKAVEELRSYL
jgi:transcriptional regulator with XRE-family HTH domain